MEITWNMWLLALGAGLVLGGSYGLYSKIWEDSSTLKLTKKRVQWMLGLGVVTCLVSVIGRL